MKIQDYVKSFSEFRKENSINENFYGKNLEILQPHQSLQYDINFDRYNQSLEDYTYGNTDSYIVERDGKKYFLSFVDGSFYKNKILLRGYFNNIDDESDEFKVTLSGDGRNWLNAHLDNKSKNKIDVSTIWRNYPLEEPLGKLIYAVYLYLETGVDIFN